MKIPEISDERLTQLIAKIKPVFEEDGKFYWMNLPDNVHPRRTAFTWIATKGEEAQLEPLSIVGSKFVVLVKWGYYGFFKPSFAEVFSQIPDQVLEEFDAFTIVGPQTRSDMFEKTLARIILNEGYQLATITLYKKVKHEATQRV